MVMKKVRDVNEYRLRTLSPPSFHAPNNKSKKEKVFLGPGEEVWEEEL
jgi:hypothetical protein